MSKQIEQHVDADHERGEIDAAFDAIFGNPTDEEQGLMEQIVDRACEVYARADRGRTGGQPELDRTSLTMDLMATHHQVGLRLEELLEADDFNFAHDVFGIMRHMQRPEGQLGDCFVPRFAKPAEEE